MICDICGRALANGTRPFSRTWKVVLSSLIKASTSSAPFLFLSKLPASSAPIRGSIPEPFISSATRPEYSSPCLVVSLAPSAIWPVFSSVPIWEPA